MMLCSLRLLNFRQFKGEHSLSFASGTDGRNVTIIFGANGRGKTGLLRAVLFCLFGDRTPAPDAGVEQDKLALVNRSALEEAEGQPVQCAVDLCFEHDTNRYTLSRRFVGLKQGAEIVEQSAVAVMHVTTPEGNTNVLDDPNAIDEEVAHCVDPRVREYFFFDGEKIERLTRANAQQRQDVSRGIRNILNIDTLVTAQRALARLHRKLNGELGRTTGGEFGQTLKAINDCSARRDAASARQDQVEQEIALAQDELRKVDRELDGIKEIAGLLDERKEKERAVDEGEEHLIALSERCRQLAARLSLNLLNPTLDAVYGEIEKRKKTGEIPAAIRGDLLDQIVERRTCICGRALSIGSPEHERILGWKHKAVDDDLSDCALEIWRHLSTIRSNRRNVADDADAVLQGMAVTRNRLDQLHERLGEIAKEIGGDVRSDAAQLQAHRDAIGGKLIKLEAEVIHLAETRETLRAELDVLESKRREIEKRQGIQSELQRRADLASRTSDHLQRIFDEFTAEVKERLGKLSTERFRSLLDKEGLVNFTKITVGADYSLQILDRWGEPFLANISAGQRQVMSVSFILALTQLAAGEEALGMPLFMDTPFGRLSRANRESLIRVVPEVCAQWILLATDTEIGQPEMSVFRQGGAVGACYELRPLPDGSSMVAGIQL